VAAAALVGVSAFAEERHERGTDAWRERGGQIRREGARDSRERAQRDETRNEPRDEGAVRERSRRESGSEIDVRGSRDRSHERNGSYDRNERNRGGYDGNRNRGHESNRGYDRGSHRDHQRGRQPYYAHGRVSRVHPYNGGYRVWIDGARHPFFVPHRHYHRDRFRIGLSIRLGGWYNDAGYYDYYDGRSTGELYGVVESVDYRRNTFVVRNEATGNFVTVIARGREADRLRAGDVVEIWGEWSRRGYFEARDVDRVDSYYRR
jgi:hypothetical protein